jgi:cysteine-rich repeat protein
MRKVIITSLLLSLINCHEPLEEYTHSPRTYGVCEGVPTQLSRYGSVYLEDSNARAVYEKKERSCDGLDNDCDSVIDENPEIGLCRETEVYCVIDQGWRSRVDDRVGEELCDGLDNDCDGRTDEDPTDLPPPLDNQLGICSGGKKSCQRGSWTENLRSIDGYSDLDGVSGDGLDNDCDGAVDEGYCGDGIVQPTETCDPNNNQSQYYCNSNCSMITGYCGDGIRQRNEGCDGETWCSSSCQGTPPEPPPTMNQTSSQMLNCEESIICLTDCEGDQSCQEGCLMLSTNEAGQILTELLMCIRANQDWCDSSDECCVELWNQCIPPPTGSCEDALICVGECELNEECVLNCARETDPNQWELLTQYAQCLETHQCMDTNCIYTNCSSELSRCID